MTDQHDAATALATSYRENGFNGRLGYGAAPALIVVDFVNAYLDPNSPLYAGVEQACRSAERVLAAARQATVPVLFTTVAYDDATDGGLFRKKITGLNAFSAGSPFGRIADPLRPQPGERIISKKYASAFFDTSLATELTLLRRDSVVIVGLSTSGCVRATAVDAMQLGFIPIVVEDAVGDRHPSPHEASLFDLDAKYADVISETDAIRYIRSLTHVGSTTR